VLITAETGRALNVLKDKLPEDMRPLWVSLLGQGGDGFAELNSSIQSITTRFATWSPGAYDNRIADVDGQLDVERRSLAKIDTELRSLREEVGRGTGRSARIERLRREARQYMDQCRDEIPVWIMPRYLVAEMVDPALDAMIWLLSMRPAS
jgi:hypothetical protein